MLRSEILEQVRFAHQSSLVELEIMDEEQRDSERADAQQLLITR